MQQTSQLIQDIEDHVVPQLRLNPGEARIYYALLRRSHLANKRELVTSIAKLCAAIGCSTSMIKPRLCSMEGKGLIRVVATGWAGTTIEVLLPRELPSVTFVVEEEAAHDIEEMDFYKNANGRSSIFKREGGCCFYCGRELKAGNEVLDHVKGISDAPHSYKNVVAACHSCNSSKKKKAAEDYFRLLYKKGILSEVDLVAGLKKLEQLVTGNLRPVLEEDGV